MQNIKFKRNNIICDTEVYVDGKLSKYSIRKVFRTGHYSVCYNYEQVQYVCSYKEAKEIVTNLICSSK